MAIMMTTVILGHVNVQMQQRKIVSVSRSDKVTERIIHSMHLDSIDVEGTTKMDF